jgi:hypothetical protein
MPIHKAQAGWHGTFDDGEGKMRLGSGAFEGVYSYRSRMEDSARGTNLEELLGAAHAGCYSMYLARRLLMFDEHDADPHREPFSRNPILSVVPEPASAHSPPSPPRFRSPIFRRR